MRSDIIWSGLGVALGCFVSLVGGHTAANDLESVRFGPAEDRFPSDSYTVANINITYEDEHGEMYTETTEVSFSFFCYFKGVFKVLTHFLSSSSGIKLIIWPIERQDYSSKVPSQVRFLVFLQNIFFLSSILYSERPSPFTKFFFVQTFN